MQFGDVSAPLLGANPEGLVGDVEDRMGFWIREPCLPLGLLVGALCPLDLGAEFRPEGAAGVEEGGDYTPSRKRSKKNVRDI